MSSEPKQQLPDGYDLLDTLDLTKDTRLAIMVNLTGLVMLFGSGALFFWLIQIVRPAFDTENLLISLNIEEPAAFFLPLLLFLGANFVVIVLHEAVHGLCFWLFTGKRPKFGFRGFYAFAAAPDWYFPKCRYIMVGLAPLVVLTLLGWIVLLIAPVPWLFPTLLIVTLNFSGAVGDMYTVIWLLRKPEQFLVRDFGDRM